MFSLKLFFGSQEFISRLSSFCLHYCHHYHRCLSFVVVELVREQLELHHCRHQHQVNHEEHHVRIEDHLVMQRMYRHFGRFLP